MPLMSPARPATDSKCPIYCAVNIFAPQYEKSIRYSYICLYRPNEDLLSLFTLAPYCTRNCTELCKIACGCTSALFKSVLKSGNREGKLLT